MKKILKASGKKTFSPKQPVGDKVVKLKVQDSDATGQQEVPMCARFRFKLLKSKQTAVQLQGNYIQLVTGRWRVICVNLPLR